MRRINQVKEQVKTPSLAYEDIEKLLIQPFSKEILNIKAPDDFKMTTMEAYDSLFDPTNHLH